MDIDPLDLQPDPRAPEDGPDTETVREPHPSHDLFVDGQECARCRMRITWPGIARPCPMRAIRRARGRVAIDEVPARFAETFEVFRAQWKGDERLPSLDEWIAEVIAWRSRSR